MNLAKECIRFKRIEGTTYYQMRELEHEGCVGCVRHGVGADDPICNELFSTDSCKAGIWITADMKKDYSLAFVLSRIGEAA